MEYFQLLTIEAMRVQSENNPVVKVRHEYIEGIDVSENESAIAICGRIRKERKKHGAEKHNYSEINKQYCNELSIIKEKTSLGWKHLSGPSFVTFPEEKELPHTLITYEFYQRFPCKEKREG